MADTTPLDFAIDLLYAGGWNPGDGRECEQHPDGRAYPTIERVQRELRDLGHELEITHVQLFDCHRASWTDEEGRPAGAVVGSSEAETAIDALARVRQTAGVRSGR